MRKFFIIYLLFMMVGLLSSLICAAQVKNPEFKKPITISKTVKQHKESAIHTIVVELGPYNLRHKYKIMEGPYAWATFRIGDAVGTTIHGTKVDFVEDEKVKTFIPSLSDNKKASPSTTSTVPLGKIGSMDLYWFRGARVDVIDENGKVLPHPIYLCHGRIDLFPSLHKQFFPQASPTDLWLCVFTQGCNVITLPEGYGVPVAAGEKMRLNLKALNGTTEHKRIKLRCTIYLAKDQELNRPVSALNWFVPHIFVIANSALAVTTQKSCSLLAPGTKRNCSQSVCCMSAGEDAPNDANHRGLVKNAEGQILTSHWVVPTGWHTYATPITRHGFASNGPIRAVWGHAHPFCETISLVEVLNGKSKKVFTIHCRTTCLPGTRLKHIDFISAPQGLPLNKNANYFLTTTYNNTSGKPQDAMASAGIFFSDLRFKKPAWAHSN